MNAKICYTGPPSLHRSFWNCRVGELDTEVHQWEEVKAFLRSEVEKTAREMLK
jgi:hypothetical protein